MDKFIQSLFDEKVKLNENHSDNTDKIITESIIYNKVGSYENLEKVYAMCGKYGSRDDIMYENVTFANPCEDRPNTAAVLAAAKDANSPLYDTYLNAIQVAKTYLEKMKEEFGIVAKDKLDVCEKKLEDHDMVQDSLSRIVNPEGCCK